MIQLNGVCLICPLPKIVKRDEKNRLHSEVSPSIEWKDKYSQYYLHGVRFEKELWKEIVTKKISAKKVLSLSNIEQRMATLRIIGIEAVLEGATLVDHAKGYELYKIENVFTRIAYYLKYKDPSTDRWYVSGIHPEVGAKKSVIKALAWKFHIADDEVDNETKLFDQES
mgnify:FL=1